MPVTVMQTLSSGEFSSITDFTDLYLEFKADLGSSLDAATLAWIAAVGSGNVSSGRQTLVDNLIVGLKADGVWAKLDRLWIFAAENEASALVDLVALASATKQNGGALTFTVDRGYQDASNPANASYIDSNFNPTTAPSPHFVQNSGCLFGWLNYGGATVDVGGLVGTSTTIAVGYSRIYPDYSGSLYFDLNSSDLTGLSTVASYTLVTGLYLVNRVTSTDHDMDVNGSQIGTKTISSSSPLNANFTAMSVGGGSVYLTKQISAFGFGSGLTGGERVAIYNRSRTYMTAVGVP